MADRGRRTPFTGGASKNPHEGADKWNQAHKGTQQKNLDFSEGFLLVKKKNQDLRIG